MESFPLREIVQLLLVGPARARWLVREDDLWCHLSPRGYPVRRQGWKLHVSATSLAAPIVLHRAAEVLVAHECAFKFAGTLVRVWELTSKDTDRAQAGKVLTAYPRDDDHLRQLAPLLDRATAGLPGPTILSDRPYREDSLVHYRFGAFAGVPVLTNDGRYEVRLEAPDGRLVEDARRPWFCPPSWAPLPYPGKPARPATRPAVPAPVLLGGRFRVHRAVRHAARGGTYRAIDMHDGTPAIVKQARAHISNLTYADNACDGLRREAAMLRALPGLAPRELALFEQGPHLFLAMEELAGQSLRDWVRRWWEESAQPDPSAEGVPVAEAVAMAARLADLIDEVHERGLVLRDLTANHVLIDREGSLRLIDAELAARPGEWVANAHTPGFAAPELLPGPAVGPAPDPAADHYALGTLLYYLVTGGNPPLAPDAPAPGRPPQPRIALSLRYAAARNPAARRLAPAILGLTQTDPRQRWHTAQLREILSGAGGTPALSTSPAAPTGTDPVAGLEPDRQARLLSDGLAHLLAKLPETGADRLVPTSPKGSQSDPCNVQYGAAGVLGVLVRASEVSGTEPLREAVTRLARWLDRRRCLAAPLLPGLYFGRAGTAWALHTAARHLGEAAMAERALELAASLPVQWPNPDLAHGSAGAGLANLHLWYETKEPVLLERVRAAADHLQERASRTDDGNWYWQVPPEFDSKLAGTTHLGFAHGVAGIGTFLLAAAQATGERAHRALAEQAGQTLAMTAIRVAGGAYWPNDVAGPDRSDLRYHWCSGASGVGTFLLRLWLATGEPRYRELAQEAAVMVHRGRWLGGVAACHGTAGNGELLLDLAAVASAEPYRGWAEELAAVVYARHAMRDGRLVASDEPDTRVNLGFGTGVAGVVGFLLRLRHGGPRWWMVDDPRLGAG